MDAVVIEFIGDTRGLAPAADQLKALGQISQQEYDKFIESNQEAEDAMKSFEKRMKEQKDAAVKNLKEQAEAFNQLKESIPTGAIDEHGQEMEKTAKKGQTLKSQLKSIKEEMAQLEMSGQKNTARFKELAKQGGILTDQLGDTSAQLRVLGSDEKYIQAVGSAMTGLVGAFSAGQGAVALFGDENEDMQKTMMKLFAAMSLVQGLEAAMVTLNKDSAATTGLKAAAQELYNFFVDQGTGKLKLFNIAAAASVAGLVIIGIIAAVNAWKKYSAALSEASRERENLKKIEEAALENYSAQQIELKNLISIVKNENSTNQDKQRVLQTVNEKYGDTIGHFKNIEDLENRFIDRAEAYIKVMELRAKAQAAMNLATEEYETVLKSQNEREEKSNEIIDDATTGWGKFWTVMTQGQSLMQDVKGAKAIDETITSATKNQEFYLGKFNEFTKAAQDLVEQFNFDVKTSADKTKTAILDIWTNIKPVSPLPSPDDLQANVTEPSIKIVADFYKALDELQAAEKEKNLRDIEEIKQARIESFITAVNIADQSFDKISQFSQQALTNEIANLDQQLANKQITQAAYDKAVKAAKTKEAKREKELAIFKALVDIPAAVIAAGIITPQAIAAGILGFADLALIAGQKIPTFYKGTPKAPAGLKWVGEKGPELINDGGGYPIITNKESMQLVNILNKYNIPHVPSLQDAELNMLNAGMAIPDMPGINYKQMAEAFAGEVKKNPGLNINIDQNGFEVWMQKSMGRTNYLDKKFKS